MNIEYISEFAVLAQVGNYLEASNLLYISQSSLSKHIQAMERELDVKLFKKTHHGVELTQAGADFYAYACSVLPAYHAELAKLKSYDRRGASPLNVGALPLVDEYGISDSFSSYWVAHPDVQIEYYERSQGNLVDKLQRRRLDLALLRLDLLDTDAFAYTPLVRDELIVVCPASSELARRRAVKIAELRNERFIMLEERSDITQMFQRTCEAAGFFPNTPLHHSRHRMLIKAVQNKMGITVLPRRLLAAYHDRAADVAGVPFAEPVYSMLGFAWLADAQLSPIAQEFVDFVSHDFSAQDASMQGNRVAD